MPNGSVFFFWLVDFSYPFELFYLLRDRGAVQGRKDLNWYIKRGQQETNCSAPFPYQCINTRTREQAKNMNQAIDFAQASIESYKKHGILEDVIHDTSFQPSGILAVEYSSSAPVAMGNTLPTEKARSKPQFQFTFNKQMQKSVPQANAYVPQDDDLFTLVMTDPDAPSKTDHKWSEFCHLVECDLKLLNEATHETSGATEFFASEFNTKGSNTLIEYMGPAPPKGSGPHRYVFLLYKQPKGVDSSKFSKIKDRPNWGYGTPATGVGKWAKENNLQLVASNFFYAETK